jgi:putative SOS response-associated peptidase YedK
MITSPFEAMARLFGAAPGLPGPDAPRLNIAPTQAIPVAISGAAGRKLVAMRWGFVPHWCKSLNGGPFLINARAETIAEKPAFRAAARERRCLIPADAFYEWQENNGAKIPFMIAREDGAMMALAGIWQVWGADGKEKIATCAIITCAASTRLAPVHHRMPVVIAPADYALWLGEAGPGAAPLMVPAPEDVLNAAPADENTRAILARRAV